ncbi:MAG: halocyanin precursor-like protein [Chloroflexi bacterium]|nr:halocyanin precursor-like protein [Chloroflexota bacterium]
MRLVTRAILALALVGAVAACGGAPASSSATETATLNASEFAFDPGTLEVAAGAKLTLTLANKGTIEHDFTIDSLAIRLHAPVGQSPSVTTDAMAAGAYDFYCSIPGHKEAGMIGTLTVK